MPDALVAGADGGVGVGDVGGQIRGIGHDVRCERALWYHLCAGWSSLVARRAHNPEVVGSNPTPATISSSVRLLKVTWNSISAHAALKIIVHRHNILALCVFFDLSPVGYSLPEL